MRKPRLRWSWPAIRSPGAGPNAFDDSSVIPMLATGLFVPYGRRRNTLRYCALRSPAKISYPRPLFLPYPPARLGSLEGRLPETFGWRSKVRRPRAGFVTPHSGGPGTPPYGHYEPCARSSLDTRKAKSRKGKEARARSLVGEAGASRKTAGLDGQKACGSC